MEVNHLVMKEVTALRKEVKRSIDSADEKTLKMIQALLEVEQESDWWDGLDDEAKASIERGLKDADAGRVTPHDVVMKKYRKWL
jgi:predicted transcriptional regulator